MIRQQISIKYALVSGLLSILLLFPIVSQAQQTLEQLNQALRYSRYSRISPKILPVKESDRTFVLQMPVEKIEENIEFGVYNFSYGILSSFQEPITAQNMINLTEEDLVRETDFHFYFEKKVTIPEEQEMAFALFRATDTRQGDEYYYHADLISPFVFGYPDFWAYYGDNIPFDQNFIVKNDAVEFRGSTTAMLHKFHYPASFDVPLPPMEIRPAAVPREVTVNYQGDFLLNTPKKFEEDGYFLIQSDTNSTKGMMLRTVHDAFPKVKDYDEMVEMVVYISTRKEHESLNAAEDAKIALDQYWIGLTKDEDQAKKLIREYFKQIEFANILFTDFKEGWKTDRGMVYTVMGPPNEVSFKLNGEIWSYLVANSNSKITFTFARVKNILTPNYYILNRSRSLQPEWFKSITLWRNGQMAF
ncbi:GWxTD domain-containing protein [Arthrospiribacter ruber]|uniref:GWxTD domain-containing protein n=1 Tax=Arthrospiribacter ruber TaxID=2487934 RepID=A0A951J128_9BACT|nr:GWxTD domain-containing protein [Arthrospiribacter ruber]MBW3469969.1 GWxTD domain-containing protein [Arthrospiribacter ruber]